MAMNSSPVCQRQIVGALFEELPSRQPRPACDQRRQHADRDQQPAGRGSSDRDRTCQVTLVCGMQSRYPFEAGISTFGPNACRTRKGSAVPVQTH